MTSRIYNNKFHIFPQVIFYSGLDKAFQLAFC
jgi:hypothetical protein